MDASTCPVGSRIYFQGEKRPYRVRARSARYLVCTKPYNPRRTVLYTIVDVTADVRGTENLVLGLGAESDEDCAQMLGRLEGTDATLGWRTEVSHRNRVPLKIERIVGAARAG